MKKKFILGIMLMAIAVSVPIADAAQAPFITIDPIGNHTVGDVFFVNGTTNLPNTDTIAVSIYPSSINPGDKWQNGYEPGISFANVPISSSNVSINLWSLDVTDAVKNQLNATSSPYVGLATSTQNASISAYQQFTLLPEKNATLVNPQTTCFTTHLPSFTPIQTTSETPTISLTTPASPLPLALPIAVIAAMLIVRVPLRKK